MRPGRALLLIGAEAKAALPDLKKVTTEEAAVKEAINNAIKLIDK